MSKRALSTKKRSLARPFVVTVAAIGLPGAIAVVGCGTGNPSAGGGFRCKGGTNAGQVCGVNADCNSNNCAQGTCTAGANLGQPCNAKADCLGSKCTIAGESCGTCALDCGLCPAGSPSSGAPICT